MARLPYNFDVTVKKLAEMSDGSSVREQLLKMDKDDFNRLNVDIGYLKRFVTDFDTAAKEADRERRNDYEAMVRYAKKRFNKIDIAVLDVLEGTAGEYCMYFSGIVSGVRTALEEPQTESAVHKSVQLLKRRGLIEVVRGLFDDDGYTAGSGYQYIEHKAGVIERILQAYHTEDKQMELGES